MIRWLIGYGATALTFLVADGIWLAAASPILYRPALGALLAPQFRLLPAVAFYLIYTFGILAFAAAPGFRHGMPLEAAAWGAALGLVAYATYDLTNLATLKDFPATLALIDLIWGIMVTALAASAGCIAMLMIAGRG